MYDGDPTQDDDLSLEDRELLAELESGVGIPRPENVLTPKQREFMEAGSTFVPTAGSSVASMDTGVGIVLSSVGDQGLTRRVEVALDGLDDAILRETINKHTARLTEADHKNPAVRDAAFVAAVEEAARIKKAKRTRESQMRTPPKQVNQPPAAEGEMTPEPATDTPEHKYVPVSVDLGLAGRLDLMFRDAVIHNHVLVLVADPPAPGFPSWAPPNPGDDGQPVPLRLLIGDIQTPILALAIGVSYPYAGGLHYVLLIDRQPD